jgi:hypothetical protein
MRCNSPKKVYRVNPVPLSEVSATFLPQSVFARTSESHQHW